jgi:hypothetical protein
MVFDGVVLFLSQLLFSYFRNINFRHISEGSTIKAVLSSAMVKLTILVSTYYGVASLVEANFVMIAVYFIGGAVGDIFSLKSKK